MRPALSATVLNCHSQGCKPGMVQTLQPHLPIPGEWSTVLDMRFSKAQCPVIVPQQPQVSTDGSGHMCSTGGDVNTITAMPYVHVPAGNALWTV